MVELRRLGKYEILDQLGVGGMGTVYRARDTVLERLVAVKLLHRERDRGAGDEPGCSRFLNEARAVARLNHPGIVAVYDFSDADPAGAFFAMEYVEGGTIEDYVHLATEARLSHALNLMHQLLDGLGFAHRHGVIHRDIKPSNLLVTHDRRLKITDFGIAKIGVLPHTMTGTMLGTPAYIAPERYLGGGADLRGDIYSAGVVFYELLTGRRPFSGSLSEITYQICHAVPSPASVVEPKVPASFDPVLAKALAKDPGGRYQSAAEFAAALAALSEVRRLPARGQSADWTAGREDETARVMPAGEPPAPHGWSAAELAQLEQRLTPILGPMARIVVKRAAASTNDRDRLREELVAQLRTDEERRRFLGGAEATSAAPTGSAAAGAPTVGGDNREPMTTIPIDTLERATKVFVRYIGPIGAVLARKTARAAPDETDFFAQLAARIPDGPERAKFLAEISAGPRGG